MSISICKLCGLCAEVCPFDAIKMGHDYEVAGYERYKSFLWDLDKLVKPQFYDVQLHLSDYPREAS